MFRNKTFFKISSICFSILFAVEQKYSGLAETQQGQISICYQRPFQFCTKSSTTK